MFSKLLLRWILLLLAPLLVDQLWADDLSTAEPTAIDDGGHFLAVPSVDLVSLNEHRQLELDVYLECRKGFQYVRNPFFAPSDNLPIRVAVIDNQKEYVGDLIVRNGLDLPKKSTVSRYLISAGQRLGTRLLVNTGDQSVTTKLGNGPYRRVDRLGPGTYFVRATYTRVLLDATSEPLEKADTEYKVIGQSRLLEFAIPTAAKSKRHVARTDRFQVEWSLGAPLVAGETGVFDFYLINDSEDYVDVYNPLLSRLYMPANLRLDILDAEGGQIANVFAFEGGSSLQVSSSAWIRMPPRTLISTQRRVKLDMFDTPAFDRLRLAPRRTIGLQLVILDRLVSPNPFRNSSDGGYRRWVGSFHGKVVATSDVVSVELSQ